MVDHHGLWIIMEYRALMGLIMDYHGLLWIIVAHCGFIGDYRGF